MSINFFITIFVWIVYNEFIFILNVYYGKMIKICALDVLEGNIWNENGI